MWIKRKCVFLVTDDIPHCEHKFTSYKLNTDLLETAMVWSYHEHVI